MTYPDTWNPNQYDRFRAERSQPFRDLLAMVRRGSGMQIADLGCGTGELTRELHETLQAKQTLGIDNSENMLARAMQLPPLRGLSFAKGDLSSFELAGKLDLIFSNAAIQWVPHHPQLLSRLTELLDDDGQLAIQMPANDDHATHEAARAVAGREPYRNTLGGWIRKPTVLRSEEYAMLLHRLGYRSQEVVMRVYPHVLESREAVIDWVRGTLLTDYQKRLPAEMWAAFLDAYREALFDILDDERPFFYPLKRILIWAQR